MSVKKRKRPPRKKHPEPITLRFRKSVLDEVANTGRWGCLPELFDWNKLHIPTEFLDIIETTVEWMGYNKKEVEVDYGESEHHVIFVIRPLEMA